MAKKLTVTGYIVRDGNRIRRRDLSNKEQKRLATAWNSCAMEAAGYIQAKKSIK